MKRIFSAVLAIIIFLLTLSSCTSGISNTAVTTTVGTGAVTSAEQTGTLNPDGSRKPFEKCDFYESLGYIDGLYKQHYIYEYDSESVYEEVKKCYDNGDFDMFSGEDLTMMVTNTFIQLIGDLYGAFFTENEYKDFTAEMEGNYVGIGITIVYLENIEYNSVKGDNNSEKVTGGMMVVNIDDSSKANGILELGDVIIRIEDENVYDIGFDESANRVRGEVGTKVGISILRGVEVLKGDGDPYAFEFDTSNAREIDIEAERVDFVAETVEHSMLDGGIAYIKILQFSVNTEYEFLESLVELIDSGAKKFIFDVRGNPGGSVDSVVPILSIILDYDKNADKKAVFAVCDREGNEDKEYLEWSEMVMDYYDISEDDKASDEIPYANIAKQYEAFAKQLRGEAESLSGDEKEEKIALAKKYDRYASFEYNLPEGSSVVVLTNGATASAGELFTKILSDFGVSYTIGEKTFGKGSMQTMFYAKGYTTKYGVVKITANTYRSPYSENYNDIGIEPDKKVELDSVKGALSIYLIDKSEDSQLSAAREYLK